MNCYQFYRLSIAESQITPKHSSWKNTRALSFHFYESGIQAQLSWDLCFNLSQGGKNFISLALRPLGESALGKVQAHVHACFQDSFLRVVLDWGFLAGYCQRAPSVPYWVGLSNVAVDNQGVSANKTEVPVFSYLITKVTPFQCYHILLVRIKLLRGRAFIKLGPPRGRGHWSSRQKPCTTSVAA